MPPPNSRPCCATKPSCSNIRLYWYNMPAILKQYFDSVLTYGFAYGTGGDRLKDKNFVPSITIGTPERDYRADGEAHFRVLELCKPLEQTAYYMQMRYIAPFYFHGTSPRCTAGKKLCGGRKKMQNGWWHCCATWTNRRDNSPLET